MGRLVRFLLVLNMWFGFNYGVLFNLYQALPTNDRLLFMFVYIVLITLPPCIFYAYITFIYEKNYVHYYELKKFTQKKLRTNTMLIEALMTGAGLIYRDGGYKSPEFNSKLLLLQKQIGLTDTQIEQLKKTFLNGQSTNFPIKSFIHHLSLIRKLYGPHFSSWMFLALIKMLEVSGQHITYQQSLLKTIERIRGGLNLKQDIYYRLENNFLLFDSEQKSNFTNYSKYTYFYSFSETDGLQQKLKLAYEILGLPINTSSEEVHRQYRKLVFKYHPDRLSQAQQQNPEILKETKEKLEKIYSAYQTICKYNNKKSAERAQPI